MANLYWYRGGGGTAAWDSQSSAPNYDNWWTDEAHTTPSTALPTTDDAVYFLGATAPSTGPGGALTLTVWDDSAITGTMAWGLSVNVTIASGGTLNCTSFTGKVSQWGGDASAAGTVVFGSRDGKTPNTDADGSAVLGDNIMFREFVDIESGATTGDNCWFQHGSSIRGTIGRNCRFYGISDIDGSSAVCGYGAQFHGYNTISLTATLEDGDYYVFSTMFLSPLADLAGTTWNLCSLGSVLTISGSGTFATAMTVKNNVWGGRNVQING